MSEGFRRWWPALPAALILYWVGSDFIARYPQEQARSGATPDPSAARIPCSPSPASFRGRHGQSFPTAPPENPFRPIHAAKAEGHANAVAIHVEPPPRNYVLKGTVGRDVATITNRAGQKMIVKACDTIDSAEVISIEPNHVVLKDRAGKLISKRTSNPMYPEARSQAGAALLTVLSALVALGLWSPRSWPHARRHPALDRRSQKTQALISPNPGSPTNSTLNDGPIPPNPASVRRKLPFRPFRFGPGFGEPGGRGLGRMAPTDTFAFRLDTSLGFPRSAWTAPGLTWI